MPSCLPTYTPWVHFIAPPFHFLLALLLWLPQRCTTRGRGFRSCCRSSQVTQCCHEAGRRKGASGNVAWAFFLLFLLWQTRSKLMEKEEGNSLEQRNDSWDSNIKIQIFMLFYYYWNELLFCLIGIWDTTITFFFCLDWVPLLLPLFLDLEAEMPAHRTRFYKSRKAVHVWYSAYF